MNPGPLPPHTQADAALASATHRGGCVNGSICGGPHCPPESTERRALRPAPPLSEAIARREAAELTATRRCQIMVTADFTDLGLEPAAFDKAVWAARAELQAELARVFARPELGLGSGTALQVQPCIEIETAVRIYDPASEPRYIGVQAAPGAPGHRADVDVLEPGSL